MTYLIQWGSLMSGLAGFFLLAANTVPADTKRNWGIKINSFVSLTFSEIIYWACLQFIKLFDNIYVQKKISKTHGLVWALISLSVACVFSYGFVAVLILDRPLQLWKLLTLGSVFGILFSLMAQLALISKEWFSRRFFLSKLILIAIFVVIFGNIITVIHLFTLKEDLELIQNFKILNSITFDSFCFLLATALSIPLFYIIMIKILPRFPISPTRSLISSALTIIILAACFYKYSINLFFDISQGGSIYILYILLNLYIDCLSLLETRLVFELVKKGGVLKIIIIAAFDIIISASLFLLLPLSTGWGSDFFNAIIFTGDKPWIGILFWSTFATSFLLHMFIFSTVILVIFLSFTKIIFKQKKIFPTEQKPILSIGLASGIILTIIIISTAIFNNFF